MRLWPILLARPPPSNTHLEHHPDSGPFLHNGPHGEEKWDRVDSKPMQTKHMKVDATGQVHESTFEEARKALSILSRCNLRRGCFSRRLNIFLVSR